MGNNQVHIWIIYIPSCFVRNLPAQTRPTWPTAALRWPVSVILAACGRRSSGNGRASPFLWQQEGAALMSPAEGIWAEPRLKIGQSKQEWMGKRHRGRTGRRLCVFIFVQRDAVSSLTQMMHFRCFTACVDVIVLVWNVTVHTFSRSPAWHSLFDVQPGHLH